MKLIDKYVRRGVEHQPLKQDPIELHNGLMHNHDSRSARLIDRTLRNGCVPHGCALSFRDGSREAPIDEPYWKSDAPVLEQRDHLLARLLGLCTLLALSGCHGEISPGAEVRWRAAPQAALELTNDAGQRVRVDLERPTRRGQVALRGTGVDDDVVETVHRLGDHGLLLSGGAVVRGGCRTALRRRAERRHVVAVPCSRGRRRAGRRTRRE